MVRWIIMWFTSNDFLIFSVLNLNPNLSVYLRYICSNYVFCVLKCIIIEKKSSWIVGPTYCNWLIGNPEFVRHEPSKLMRTAVNSLDSFRITWSGKENEFYLSSLGIVTRFSIMWSLIEYKSSIFNMSCLTNIFLKFKHQLLAISFEFHRSCILRFFGI